MYVLYNIIVNPAVTEGDPNAGRKLGTGLKHGTN